MKKFLSIIIVLTICFSLIGNASALDKVTLPPDTPSSVQRYIPEGATLETIVLNDPTLVTEANNTPYQNQSTAAAAAITLKNRVFKGNYYYSDQAFLSDAIEGPMATGPKITFEETTTAGFSGEFGVEASVVTATFGVNFSKQVTIRKEFQFDPIPANRFLYYNAYVNYAVYEFDVYSGSSYIGTSSYWVPVGIVVTQRIGY